MDTMFAIQWGLCISNIISCIPAVPILINPAKVVDSFFDTAPTDGLDLIVLMMKFQFGGLFWLYVLGTATRSRTVVVRRSVADRPPFESLRA